MKIVKETHNVNPPIIVWLNYFLNAAIKFNTKLWKPPKISFDTLDVYEEVWVPGKT